jgi:RNA polymerase sigma-70 factor, ECF subfamily
LSFRGRSTDRGAFGAQLISRVRALRAYANMLTGNRAAADDLMQDTFERALRGAEQFRSGSNLTAWLRRIMRNLFTDRCRQGTRFISMTHSDLAERFTDESQPDPADRADRDVREFLTAADVKAALGAIDRPLREIFVLAHLKRQSYQAISAELGIPVSTVGTRLWRARARLRVVLVNAGPPDKRGAEPPPVPARPPSSRTGGDPAHSLPPVRAFSKARTYSSPAV